MNFKTNYSDFILNVVLVIVLLSCSSLVCVLILVPEIRLMEMSVIVSSPD